jgi:hypothetical protein
LSYALFFSRYLLLRRNGEVEAVVAEVVEVVAVVEKAEVVIPRGKIKIEIQRRCISSGCTRSWD